MVIFAIKICAKKAIKLSYKNAFFGFSIAFFPIFVHIKIAFFALKNRIQIPSLVMPHTAQLTKDFIASKDITQMTHPLTVMIWPWDSTSFLLELHYCIFTLHHHRPPVMRFTC